jgi:hypothetical protein
MAPRNTPVKASELLHVLHAKALDDVSARIEIQLGGFLVLFEPRDKR